MNERNLRDEPDENDPHTIICRNCKNSWYTNDELTGDDLNAYVYNNVGWGSDAGGRPLCATCYVGLMCG